MPGSRTTALAALAGFTLAGLVVLTSSETVAAPHLATTLAMAPKPIPNPSKSFPKLPSGPVNPQQNNPPPEPSEHTMICRGPVQLNAMKRGVIWGKKSSKAAGRRGASLRPGECSLRDRPLRASEKASVNFVFMGHPDASEIWAGISGPLGACTLDPNCVFSTSVKNVSGHWEANPNVGVVMWHYECPLEKTCTF